MQLRLSKHPSTGPAPITSVAVALTRSGSAVRFDYTLAGTVSSLKVAKPAAPARADALWRTTCFEAFLRPGAGETYFEFNLSPSSAWAVYRFDAYRRGMTNAAAVPPVIKTSRVGRLFSLFATIDLAPFAVTPSARLGLAAILETQDGAKSYWALAHGGDKPDFHRADGFVGRLPFKSRA